MAVEHPQYLALGIRAGMRRRIIDARQQHASLPVRCRALHRDDTLAHRGQHFSRRKFVSDAISKTDAFEARARHDQRVRWSHRSAFRQALLFALVKLAHARVGRTAKVDHFHLRKQSPRVSRAPHRIGADPESLPRERRSSSIERPGRTTNTSPGGSRDKVAPITSPGVSSLPSMSLSECIAACNSPLSTAARICATKAPPFPPWGRSLLV